MSGSDQTLMTVTSDNGPPSLASAAEQLSVAPEDIDRDFGIVPIDPEHGRYAVRVPAGKVGARESVGEMYKGPFSNPRIESFGPPRTAK